MIRRSLIAAWSPAAVLLACLVASAVAGVAGYRALRGMADAQLEAAGDYVAHHVQSPLVSRLRRSRARPRWARPCPTGPSGCGSGAR